MIHLADRVKSANRVLLSTHRQCDGDGLGAQLAVMFALRKMGKSVSVINVDSTPKKYHFLSPDSHIQYFDSNNHIEGQFDIAIIFDTNDERLLQPLWPEIKSRCKTVVFLDHHPVLEHGPSPSKESLIDVKAASTGELAFRLIQQLNIPIDTDIARCVYTSITFDTQLYRFIRNSANSHLIAAECLKHNINPEEVHRNLFGNHTVQKIEFLSKALSSIEYFANGKVALHKFKKQDLVSHSLESDDSRDIIDIIMTIESIDAAVIFREDQQDQYKVSFRSKGSIEVLTVAESIGGGGHLHASGAFVTGNYPELKKKILDLLTEKLVAATIPKRKTGS